MLARPSDRSRRRPFAACGARALDWLCPVACVLCGAPGAVLCAACRADAVLDGSVCARCSVPLPRGSGGRSCGRCLKRAPAYDTTVAATRFEPPFDQLVRGLKFGATLAYAPLFAELLAAHVAARAPPPLDVLIPVPLSRARTAARGFNQAVEIGRPLARSLGVPLIDGCVLRVVDTAPQSALAFDARRRNVRGAFAVVDARRGVVAGRTVGVVDDVLTTGATLHELARTLKRAGASVVVNLVVARTP